VITAAALALSACSPGTAQPTSSAAKYILSATTPKAVGDIDSFNWSLRAEPESLGFTHAFDYPANTVLANLCDSLLRWNSDLSMSPGLATAYENPTPTTWVYTIRQGVKFHDGTTMTADDVVASLKQHLIPEVGSYWAYVYQNVKSIEKTGPWQVTVTTTIPDSVINQYMAATPGTVESAATLAKDGADYGNPSDGVNCTGPFKFDSWKPGQSITISRFDDYWDTSLKAKSGKVTFSFLGDPNARVNAFKTGDIDGGWLVPSNGIAPLNASGAGKMYYGLNTTATDEIVSNFDGPLGNAKVRQALLMATDRAGLIATGENGYAKPLNVLAPKSAWTGLSASIVKDAFGALNTYPYDVKKAKELVKDAGLTGKSIVIAASSATTTEGIIAQTLAAAAKAIGLKATIKTIAPDQYGALFVDPEARKGIDLFYTQWYLSIRDPQDAYNILVPGNFSNYGNWDNKKFTSLITKATSTMDAAKRGELSAQAQQIANDQLPWLPLYQAPTTLWLGSKITGVDPSINFLYYPWAATIGAAK
jgi:peptide/nickel transport system substrate-binding protein